MELPHIKQSNKNVVNYDLYIYSYNVTTALMQVRINRCLRKATKVLVLNHLMK